jgi:riboflavin kinase/FMN adenylyltransferase
VGGGGGGGARQLGFPTANLSVGEGDKLIPPEGIYAVRASMRAGTYAGALHLGPRPTFQGSPPTIELHVLDFEGDLYGERVRVDFVSWLREIRSLEVSALVDQIRDDVDAARAAVDAATRIV